MASTSLFIIKRMGSVSVASASSSLAADYFDRNLIAADVRSALGAEFEVRPLHADDYEKGE